MTWETVEYEEAGEPQVMYLGWPEKPDDVVYRVYEAADGFYLLRPGLKHSERPPSARYNSLTEATAAAETLQGMV